MAAQKMYKKDKYQICQFLVTTPKMSAQGQSDMAITYYRIIIHIHVGMGLAKCGRQNKVGKKGWQN